ncbi:3'(2'),5'-bisphosphate nucleotidase CysQ [Thiohalobacter sp. IOR34]|uniref:3'(2'),5'-bisphosphate nucleotidase CysQ n=1 Tax=Thiohalobacter sp. IOR34 TaxID=3057176 RepID=UPI0025AF71FA|nr:3'(2'),5'-bisphosphate nucleotidase CysQ [Thiohalobacter sp. IOR34]WJW75217.1 3'(2'),5'-bisphosphate nucleotidase CysQ [Thiohalobacter sp. IOR34]
MTETKDPCELLDGAKALAVEAGRKILEIYESDDFGVEEKADESPLTKADMAAHRAIVAGLAKLTPDIPVLSEESASIPFSERAGWDWYWLIDPLDGTKEFIKRNGEFTVNIALIHGHRPVLGVVHVPVQDLTYYACEGGGAYKQQDDQPPQRIRVRPLGDGPVIVAGSRSHRGDSLNRFLERLGEHEIISMGSALKLCLVAEGRADVYPRLGPTSEWDTAAAQCVVEEAGGKVTGLDMEPLPYNTKDSLLNPHFLVFGDASRDWSQYL